MLPVPFGRQVSFPQGQGSPEHAGCWAVCLGLGTSLGQSLRIPSPSLLEGKAYWQHEATPGWEHQTPQPSSAGGEHRQDKAPRGFPGRGALSGSSQPWDGISATSQEPRARAPNGQRMNPQSTGGTQTPTHHHSPPPHRQPGLLQRPATDTHIPPSCPKPGQAAHTASYPRASLFQLLFSKPTRSISQGAATAASLTHSPQHPQLSSST